MKTLDFFNLLEGNKEKSLLFEYAPGLLVGANYHITEVKHVVVDAIDCGSQADSWKETIVQLWESPKEIGKTEYMTVFKALSILKKVGAMKPYVLDAELKLEYSNSNFHTAQMFVDDYNIQGSHLIVKLAIEKTDCKAKELCGVTEEEQAKNEASCCTPGSGCC
ncbi:DUF6428 family protein [Cognatitamlana onchidii]|uniref:DUF6428 family protein n=1 Tax=Cognatitamlana onchidii TaxID=2562860 RepID=UPI0010A64408|nr:DUF6428 family protein [Algibacter onchidii]